MRIKAFVSKTTGKTRHYTASINNDGTKDLENIPIPKWVEISEEPSGFFLFHYNADGECISDTWHESLEEAKEQASFEFEIEDNDWTPMA